MKKKVILLATFAIIATTGVLFAVNGNSSNSCTGDCCKKQSCCTSQSCETACACGDECTGESCECGCSCCK